MNQQKSSLYNYIKTITTILVVIGHVTIMYTPDGAIPVAGDSVLLGMVANIIYAFHMPLFVMVSGCVFGYCLELGKYKDAGKYLYVKFKKLVIPYLVIGIFMVAPIVNYVGLGSGNIMGSIVEGILLSRDPRHLWYILSLFWIFVLYLPLREILRKGLKELVITGLLSAFVFILAFILPKELQIQKACLYQIFFYAGIVFNRYYWLAGKYLEKIISSIAIIFENRWMKRIEKDSYGIYLLHPMINYVLFYWFGKTSIHPVLLSVGIFVVIMLVSVLLTEFIRRMKLGIIIGE